jgi:hypothetical protein
MTLLTTTSFMTATTAHLSRHSFQPSVSRDAVIINSCVLGHSAMRMTPRRLIAPPDSSKPDSLESLTGTSADQILEQNGPGG